MGTKNEPGVFDCYENAEPDEPMFVLLARDPFASELVKIWSLLRAKKIGNAAAVFTRLARQAEGRKRGNAEKCREAWACAMEMAKWQRRRYPSDDTRR